jgi:iron complex transport system substrate-binding protein
MTRTAAPLLALLVAVAPSAGAAGPFRSNGKGAAEGGAAWAGALPRSPPRRIVTLAPSLTDVLVGMGLAGRIVGVTRMDDAPEVAAARRVGGFLDPNAEAVLGLAPDLVLWVTDGGARAAVERIAELAAGSSRPFPILAIPIISIADVLATPRLVGEAVGEPAAGERLARSLAGEVEAVRARAAGLRPRRVLFVVGREPLVVAGPGSFPDELLRICGARNVVQRGRAWPVYPLEQAVADDPDLVVDAATLEPAGGIARLDAIPAVRRGAVHRLERDDLIRPGPRMVRALPGLFRALHPEADR